MPPMAPTQAPGFRVPSVTPLGISSHGNPWRPHPSGLLIPETPEVETRRSSSAPYHAAVFCWLLFFPRPQKPHVPYPDATSPPPGPNSPWPLSLTLPRSIPKHDVTAEHHVDVQVHLLDVPGEDQGFLGREHGASEAGGKTEANNTWLHGKVLGMTPVTPPPESRG